MAIDFEKACDNMCSSKFIFMDKRIAEILKSIATDTKIFNLIAECMLNFNFTKELKAATGIEGKFVVPSKRHNFIALVFCVLNALDDGKIDINTLLSHNFNTNSNDPYQSFLNEVIVPFKASIMAECYGDIVAEQKCDGHTSVDPSLSKTITNRLMFLCEEIKPLVDKHKDERAQMFFDCFCASVEAQNKAFAICLFEALKMSMPEKQYKQKFSEIENVLSSGEIE